MNETPEIASFLRRLPAFGGLDDELLNSAAGAPPDNHLPPEDLSLLARQNLKSAFSQIRVSQSAMLNRFHVA